MFYKKSDYFGMLIIVLLVAGMLWFVFKYLPSQNNGQNNRPAVEGIVKYRSQIGLDYQVTLEDDNHEEIGVWKCISMAACRDIQKGQHIRFNPSPAGYLTGYSLIQPQPTQEVKE